MTNNLSSLSSDSLTALQGRVEMRPFAIEYCFRPHGGQGTGGDRFAACSGEGGGLWFYMADASGHGNSGAQVWEVARGDFDERWQELVAGPPSEEDLVRFVKRVNDSLVTLQGLRSPYLCLALGALSPDGQLMFGTFGYGAHLLVATARGPWQPAPGDAFSLKLGWVASQRWGQIPGACVIHKVGEVRRVVLMTDGFLGDDYADVQRTLQLVNDLREACARLPLAAIVPHFLNLPHDQDDASVVVVDLSRAGRR